LCVCDKPKKLSVPVNDQLPHLENSLLLFARGTASPSPQPPEINDLKLFKTINGSSLS